MSIETPIVKADATYEIAIVDPTTGKTFTFLYRGEWNGIPHFFAQKGYHNPTIVRIQPQ